MCRKLASNWIKNCSVEQNTTKNVPNAAQLTTKVIKFTLYTNAGFISAVYVGTYSCFLLTYSRISFDESLRIDPRVFFEIFTAGVGSDYQTGTSLKILPAKSTERLEEKEGHLGLQHNSPKEIIIRIDPID